MTKKIWAAAAVGLLVLFPACTDLTEVPQSAITPENFYRNEDEVIGGLASVYAQLRTTNDEYYNLSEISTDEMIVPTRGQDWYDNGKWLDIHRQTFTPTSPAGLDNINSAWVNLFQGVARANVVLAGVSSATFASKTTVTAELRALRAFYYFMLMDMFGGVPIATDPAIEARPQASRDSVFRFVEAELKAARPDLPATWSAAMNGRITKGAVDAMLASLYLNAQVFNGRQLQLARDHLRHQVRTGERPRHELPDARFALQPVRQPVTVERLLDVGRYLRRVQLERPA
ncbi:MAG: hypothetical protein AUG74_07005 [Bacteroidetes bacterium 13_1_20CM_4_60_6]|nr:MAG: hypothetical protein AUG74_07005 [Bacteroidetes bacterium 13_1_20CM_4_60_6]